MLFKISYEAEKHEQCSLQAEGPRFESVSAHITKTCNYKELQVFSY